MPDDVGIHNRAHQFINFGGGRFLECLPEIPNNVLVRLVQINTHILSLIENMK
jgi:hypothetical protein